MCVACTTAMNKLPAASGQQNTNLVSPGSSRSKVDGFVPHTRTVNLRTVGRPECGRASQRNVLPRMSQVRPAPKSATSRLYAPDRGTFKKIPWYKTFYNPARRTSHASRRACLDALRLAHPPAWRVHRGWCLLPPNSCVASADFRRTLNEKKNCPSRPTSSPKLPPRLWSIHTLNPSTIYPKP